MAMASIRNPTIIAAAAICLAALPLSANPGKGGNARDALRTADSLANAAGVPAPVKAQSLSTLGDHQLIKGDYKKAAEFYRRASMIDNSSKYRYQYALSIASDGQTDAAAEILEAIAVVSSDPMGGHAAELLMQLRGNNKQAEPAGQPKPVSVPVSPQPEPRGGQPAPVSANTTAPATAAGTVFTIQVGAFGTRENADNLVKRLSPAYKDITVSPTTSGDQTLYRVRVGTFSNREEAAAFADKLVTEGGMSARVVEK